MTTLATPLAEAVRIPAGGDVTLDADLVVPAHAARLVVFAHGSGSGRHSPRNRLVAEALQQAGCATLLLDLLTSREELADQLTGDRRFDVAGLARRVVHALDWAAADPRLAGLRAGLFGASTGAAAALIAATERPQAVGAVVSRGGRPDLAGSRLPCVQAPTLLLVGSRDPSVLELNRGAAAQMRAPVELVVVPRATHLFEEPGTLEEVARHASAWFARHLPASMSPTG